MPRWSPSWSGEYGYDGVETCAVDGMCQTACPVLINTGDLVKRLREEKAGRLATAGWTAAARHWSGTTRAAAVALDVAAALPSAVVEGLTAVGRKVLDPDVLPAWSPELPAGRHPRSDTVAGAASNRPASSGPGSIEPQAVLFASCTGTLFGPAAGGPGATDAFTTLCARASVRLVRPAGLRSLCCGTPWKSKGMRRGLEEMTARVLPALWAATREGALPVVADASSCTEGLRQMLEAAAEPYGELRVVDAVAFTVATVLPRLTVTAKQGSVALHPTCSASRLGLTDTLRGLTEAVADAVTVPATWGCCAFAGDRGLLHPELTASATAAQAAELAGGTFDAHASCNRTCELGMTRATGWPYVHVLELVERATR